MLSTVDTQCRETRCRRSPPVSHRNYSAPDCAPESEHSVPLNSEQVGVYRRAPDVQADDYWTPAPLSTNAREHRRGREGPHGLVTRHE